MRFRVTTDMKFVRLVGEAIGMMDAAASAGRGGDLNWAVLADVADELREAMDALTENVEPLSEPVQPEQPKRKRGPLVVTERIEERIPPF
jgi:hypothetical protein